MPEIAIDFEYSKIVCFYAFNVTWSCGRRHYMHYFVLVTQPYGIKCIAIMGNVFFHCVSLLKNRMDCTVRVKIERQNC